MSVEDRLDRVERILEEIEAHEGMKSHHLGSDSLPRANAPMGHVMPDGLPADSLTDWRLKRAADEAKRAAEQAQRAVEASQRAAEASQRDAEQALRDAARLKSKDYERLQEKWSEAEAEAPQRELQALRGARESLEKELQNLSRQIKRLEDDQNHPKKAPHIGPDDHNKEGAKPVDPAPEKTL